MDLGIAGRTAIVCASTRGLGLACALSLAREGVNVILNGRSEEGGREAVESVRQRAKGRVTFVAGDVTTREGQSALLEACSSPDILLNNNAGPAPANFSDLDDASWHAAIAANMIAPLTLVRAVLPGMKERRFGRIVNITSAMVTTPRPHMTLSAGSRAGLTAALKGLSIEVAKYNITINNMLPERFDTDRQVQMAKVVMARDRISFEEARARQVESIAARRLGDPQEFGEVCAFLCSVHCSYISGQNLHLDGGSYPALI